jgi:glycosyltransferase involved in cell wall biosynthesis
MDVIVLPSRNEGVPKSILEGMALGKAVIVTDVGSVRDVVSGTEGIIVPPDDPSALLEAMQMLAEDEALRMSMGRAGRSRALMKFDIRRNIRGLETIVTEMLQNSKMRR